MEQKGSGNKYIRKAKKKRKKKETEQVNIVSTFVRQT